MSADRRHDRHDRPDALDLLRDEARAMLDEAIARELRDVSPDFAAVIEAAHARDPQRVPRAALDEALALAPIVPLGSESSQRLSVRDNAELGALLAEVRGEVDAEIAALRRNGFPPVPVPSARQTVVVDRRRRWLWGAVAAAAAVLLAVASPMLATRLATSQGDPTQASWGGRNADGSRAADRDEPTPVLRHPIRPAPEPEPTPEPEVTPPEPTPVEPETGTDTIAEQPVPKARKSPRPTTPDLAEQLRSLDSEAESAWHSGDYAGAERRFRQIVALAPGSRAADLSYGDLFTLARQRSGPEQEKALWREYLAAFPRGRYADDARAGLCRRAAPDDEQARHACWQQYLGDFPSGVHRKQATRALEQRDDPAP
ncbi:MAG: hypothetical protein H0T76_04340 [Nannocystis sp.]|nr:hypothetical protein [Nannocystis sp.]MBA3545691.1 hypothetical protein [Nannocystis sp.]